MSFRLTQEQIKDRTKTVTRRLGWKDLKPGTLLQPVVKAQGIPKGGKVERIGGLIRVTDVRREALGISQDDCAREGFPCWLPSEFLAMFVRHNGCEPDAVVTRIEFEYVDARKEEESNAAVGGGTAGQADGADGSSRLPTDKRRTESGG